MLVARLLLGYFLGWARPRFFGAVLRGDAARVGGHQIFGGLLGNLHVPFSVLHHRLAVL